MHGTQHAVALLLAALRLFGAGDAGAAEDPLHARLCQDEYEAREDDFFFVSGAITQRPWSDAAPEVQEEDMAERFAKAGDQVLSCHALGGRYWEVLMRLDNYIRSLRFDGFAWNRSEWEVWEGELQFRFRGLPHRSINGLCAPPACTPAGIRDRLVPRYIAKVLNLRIGLPSFKPEDFEARELAHWSGMRLDFVVAGVDHCGTTSLHRNLMLNPDIGFTKPVKEDGFFFQHYRVLPYRRDVEEFNRAWAARGGRQPTVLGLYDSGMFRESLVRHALAQVPGLRVIVILCDPLSRFEKIFWTFFFCRPNKWALPWGARWRQQCWDSPAASLDEPDILAQAPVRDGLWRLLRLFRSRVRFIHQDSLRYSARDAFDGLAAFLGAGPFPSGTEFHRHNSAPGPRTGMCRNDSLIEALLQQFEPEYKALEELLERTEVEVPIALKLRRTRCDRPEELIINA